MIDPFTLFHAFPTPPSGAASWVDLQTLEGARAQAHFAAEQAYWARFGAWTQLAAFVAAGAAAWFTWKAARHAQTQAETALADLRTRNLARDADSRVQAWALLAYLTKTFGTYDRHVSSADQVPPALYSLVSVDHGLRQIPWESTLEEGTRIAAGIISETVLQSWIYLIDDAQSLYHVGVNLSGEFRAIQREYDPLPMFPSADGAELPRRAALYEQHSQQLPAARERLAGFWRAFDSLVAELEHIGRGGILRVVAHGRSGGVGSAVAVVTLAPSDAAREAPADAL